MQDPAVFWASPCIIVALRREVSSGDAFATASMPRLAVLCMPSALGRCAACDMLAPAALAKTSRGRPHGLRTLVALAGPAVVSATVVRKAPSFENASNQYEHFQSEPRHPRVFIYSLPRALPNGIILRDDAQCEELEPGSPASLDCLFGEEFEVKLGNSWTGTSSSSPLRLRNIDQFAMGRIFHARLLNSSWRVHDPAKADLFFVPSWTADSFPSNSTCPTAADFSTLLPFLNKCTAGRHLLVNPRVAHRRDVCEFWSGDPWPLTESAFPSTTKIALEDPVCCPFVRGANVHSIPYPGFGSGLDAVMAERLHRLSAPEVPRAILSMGALGIHGAGAGLRIIVRAQCLEAGYPECVFIDLKMQQKGKRVAITTQTYAKLVSTMLQTTFCFEPNGDTPSRKGIIDAIMCGCIPVLFKLKQKKLWPWHLQNWESFSVMIDPYKANAIRELQRINKSEVTRLRAGVAQVAKGLAYELREGANDVVETTLLYAWKLNGGHPLQPQHEPTLNLKPTPETMPSPVIEQLQLLVLAFLRGWRWMVALWLFSLLCVMVVLSRVHPKVRHSRKVRALCQEEGLEQLNQGSHVELLQLLR